MGKYFLNEENALAFDVPIDGKQRRTKFEICPGKFIYDNAFYSSFNALFDVLPVNRNIRGDTIITLPF